MWLTIFTNPKNLLIILLTVLLVVVGIRGFYYKQKSISLESQVASLTQENVNLKAQITTLNQHNLALQNQVKNNQKISDDYNSIQKRIQDVKKACTKVVAKPVEKQPSVSKVIPQEPNQGVKTQSKIETEGYVYGGEEYEKESISIYNDIVTIFNTGRMQDATSPNVPNSGSSLPSPKSTDTKKPGS